MKDRWLILSYFANVDALAPSHHIDDKIPFLLKNGIDIHLLTSPCGEAYRDLPHTRVPSLAPSGIRFEVRHFLRRKTSNRFLFKIGETLLLLPVYPFYLIEKIVLRLDSQWSWFISASIAAIVLTIKNKPRILYSTGGPVSAHIAAMIVSRITRVPYIAELQDPLVYEHDTFTSLRQRFKRRVEILICKTAASVIYLTHRAAASASKRNQCDGKTTTIYPGAIPLRGAAPYGKTPYFTLAHFGSLGGGRNLHHLSRALAMLVEEQPDLPDYFRLQLCGAVERNVKKQIEEFGYGQTLKVHGKLMRESALDLMHRVDILLLIQNTDDLSFETIPSKLYEYFHAGRPILALLYRNPELQAMLEERGHIVVPADDEAAIKKGLEIYLEKWKQDRLRPRVSDPPYTVERAVAELLSVAEKITIC